MPSPVVPVQEAMEGMQTTAVEAGVADLMVLESTASAELAPTQVAATVVTAVTVVAAVTAVTAAEGRLAVPSATITRQVPD